MSLNSQPTLLVLGLSQAKHLQDEAKGVANLVYAGPRLSTNGIDLQTEKNPRLSDILKYFKEHGLVINGVIVYADIFSLAQFCPRIDIHYLPVLCVIGDTHHGKGAITDLAYWLLQSRITVVALKQTVHHAELFESLGLNVLRLPFYAHEVRFIRPSSYFFERTVFVGSTGGVHLHRTQFLQLLRARQAEIDIKRIPRIKSFSIHNIYAASFNMPLNNDISYRIWEVMASGSVCLTKRFPEEARPYLLAQEDENVLCYDTIDECLHKIDLLNRSKDLRMRIATNAFHSLKKAKESSTTLKLLLKALSMDEAIGVFQAPSTMDKYNQNVNRVLLYEQNQNNYKSNNPYYT